MIINLAAAARVVPLTALMLEACVSQSAYEQQSQQLQQARAKSAAQRVEIARMPSQSGATAPTIRREP
jgi:hypothetical protein